MRAAKLRNYNETVRCVIQNEITNVFLNANRGLYERYHHTHLQPINPPQAHFPSGPYKIRGLLEKYPTFFFMRTPDGL